MLSSRLFTGFSSGGNQAVGLCMCQCRNAHHQVVGAFHPFLVGFQHVGFGHKANALKKRRITGRIAGWIVKLRHPAVEVVGVEVYIGKKIPTPCFHICVNAGFKFVSQPLADWAAQLIVLACKQGHGMLKIGAVAYVVVNQYVGVEKLKSLVKSRCIPAIKLGKIAVQVEVLGIAPETVFRWSVLVYPAIRPSVE